MYSFFFLLEKKNCILTIKNTNVNAVLRIWDIVVGNIKFNANFLKIKILLIIIYSQNQFVTYYVRENLDVVNLKNNELKTITKTHEQILIVPISCSLSIKKSIFS